MKNSKDQCEVGAVLNSLPMSFEKSDGKIIWCYISDKECKCTYISGK